MGKNVHHVQKLEMALMCTEGGRALSKLIRPKWTQWNVQGDTAGRVPVGLTNTRQ